MTFTETMPPGRGGGRVIRHLLLPLLLSGCTGGGLCEADPADCAPAAEDPCAVDPGCVVAEDLPGGLLAVRIGASDGDVWIAGASATPSDGLGPAAFHLAGGAWERLDTSAWDGSELWWVWASADEAVFVGNDGLILEHDRTTGALEPVDGLDPGTTFFGVWGATPADLWAVGWTEDGDGPPALWRRTDGSWAAWEDAALGPGHAGSTFFKVHGAAADDVWVVGSHGQSLHWDGVALTEVATHSDVDTSNTPLLTVDAGEGAPLAVGGLGNGLLLAYDGTTWRDRSPSFQPGLNGVCTGAGAAWAVGLAGSRVQRDDAGAWLTDHDRGSSPAVSEDWHGCAIDDHGGVWTVGGRISSRPLTAGVVAYQGPGEVPTLTW